MPSPLKVHLKLSVGRLLCGGVGRRWDSAHDVHITFKTSEVTCLKCKGMFSNIMEDQSL